MRCVAILGGLARSFIDHLFRPTYFLPENSGVRDLLIRQAQVDSEKEVTLRALLQAVSSNDQENAASQRVDTASNRVMNEVNGLLPGDEH